MKNKLQSAGLVLALLVCCIPGCNDLETSPNFGSSSANWTPLHLPGVTQNQALDAGVYAVRQYVPTVNSSTNQGTVESAWAEYQQRGGTGRIRDEAIKYNNRMRHKIILMVSASSSGSLAQCQVRVQRLDTADHRLFSQQSQFEDRPEATPIDGDAGVSAEQREAWTDLPGDREMARQVLDVVKSRVSGDVHRAPDAAAKSDGK